MKKILVLLLVLSLFGCTVKATNENPVVEDYANQQESTEYYIPPNIKKYLSEETIRKINEDHGAKIELAKEHFSAMLKENIRKPLP